MRPCLHWTAAVAFVLATAGVGCHNNNNATPVPPSTTPTAAAVSATVLPAPLVATPDVSGTTVRYRIAANLTFRELAGFAAVVSQLRVTITLPSGQTTTATYDVSVAVPASGTTPYVLNSIVDLPAGATTGRWRLDLSASGPATTPAATTPAETDLTILSPQSVDAVMVGAGDIARCESLRAFDTANLLDQIGGTVFTAGDNVYPYATAALYGQCYAPTWGRHLWRTYPLPGNHDWDSGSNAAYFSYFGAVAASPNGYYSYSMGAWTVVAVNSNIAATAGSAQYEWLRSVLAASTKACTLAIWHHPLFSSGTNGDMTFMRDAWRLLYQYGADVVVNGHDHTYERFALQDPNGTPSSHGIREFVVGTGGDSLYERARSKANSEVFENHTFGVLKLTLKSASYEWEFVPIAGQTFRDFGTGQCVSPAAR
jgi:acid phosphatase type 7